MDIQFNPVSGASQPVTLPVAKHTTDTTPVVALPTPHSADTVPAPSSGANDNADEYETAMRQAALSFKDVYALGDSDFSIFKDSTGKYITRYVSLRDGKVTYIPEPTLVKQMQIDGGGNTARISISA